MNERANVPLGAAGSRLLLETLNAAARPTVIPIPDAWDRLMATMPARAEAVRIEAERLAKLPNVPVPRRSDDDLDAEEDREGTYR